MRKKINLVPLALFLAALGVLTAWQKGSLRSIGFAPRSMSGSAGEFAAGETHCGQSLGRVVDGDTIDLADGSPVRYIGIDTPEMDWKEGRHESFAEEALEMNRRLLGDGPICLQFDQELRDKYERLLAYVYRDKGGLADGEMINISLVKEGMAKTLLIPPNTSHSGDFAQAQAQRQKKGVWGIPQGERGRRFR